MGSNTNFDQAPSPISCDGNTTYPDEDDEFDISLTESYLERVVQTRPHTHTIKKPDLLLPSSLEHYAFSRGVRRSTPPDPADEDPLITFPQSPSASRATMHADVLWNEHKFKHLDLTIEPAYLTTQPTDAFQAAIQLELCTFWKKALAEHLFRLETQWIGVAYTREFNAMKELLESLRRRMLMLGHAVETFKAGGVVDVHAMKKHAAKQQVGAQQQVSKQRTSKSHALGRSKGPNCGFGPSTTIIRYQAGEEGSKGLKEVGKESGATHSGAQTQKKKADVIDLDALLGSVPVSVPQAKKRPAEVIELDDEEDETTQTKKAKASASGEDEVSKVL